MSFLSHSYAALRMRSVLAFRRASVWTTPAALFGYAQRDLPNPPARLDRLLNVVARKVALHADKVLRRPAAREPAEGFNVLRQALPSETEPLPAEARWLAPCWPGTRLNRLDEAKARWDNIPPENPPTKPSVEKKPRQ
jgi:hypothetical protein